MLQQSERADARANRARLIAAAQEVFRERGPGAEMKEIAERAGVGIGTIYRNFPKKDDLITAIVTEAVEAIVATQAAAALIDDPVEAIRTILRGGLRVVDLYGDLLMSMMGGDMPPQCEEQFQNLDGISATAAIVRRGVDRGVFRPEVDAEVAAATIIGAFVPWEFAHLRSTRTLEQLVDAYATVILGGLMARTG